VIRSFFEFARLLGLGGHAEESRLSKGPDTCFLNIVWPHRTPWFSPDGGGGITSSGGPLGSGLVNNCPVARAVAALLGASGRLLSSSACSRQAERP
jgi:hypothetical protein